MRRKAFGILTLTLCASCGGPSSAPTQPTAVPTALSFSITSGSLVVNPKVPASVSLSDFQFQILVNNTVAATLPGTTTSTTVRVPVGPAAGAYHLNLVGPAGFILSQACDGAAVAGGSVICSGQIVDTRAVCDDSIAGYVYKSADRLTLMNKCTAVIVTLDEVSDSDEDDADREAHGIPDPRFASMLTAGNATMNGWLVLEAVCMGDIVKNPEAMDSCKSFKANYPKTGPAKNLAIPARGKRAVVVGISVRDQRHANWAEIHGISYIFPIPDDPASADFAPAPVDRTRKP